MVTLGLIAGSAAAQSPGSGLEKAGALVAAGNFAAAESRLEALAAQYPDEARIHAALGEVELELRDYESALERFEAAVELAPGEADYQFLLGRARGHRAREIPVLNFPKKIRLGKRTRESFERAAELDPRHAGARLALVSFHLKDAASVGGDKQKVPALAEALKEIDEAMFHRAGARIALDAGDLEAAFGHYRAALVLCAGSRHCDDGRTRREFAAALLDHQRWEEVLEVLAPVSEPSAGAPLEVLLFYGRAAAESGRHSEAGARALERYIAAEARRKPAADRALSHYYRARIFQSTDDCRKARDSYQTALALDEGRDLPAGARRRAKAALGAGCS